MDLPYVHIANFQPVAIVLSLHLISHKPKKMETEALIRIHESNDSNGDISSDTSSSSSAQHLHIGDGALDESRLCYKSSIASLRSVLTTISNSHKELCERLQNGGRSTDNRSIDR